MEKSPADPVYSIIIPHHNIPKLLQRLLDSIPRREDTEIIVVDDNSSPDVVDFGQFPGCDRPDVKIVLDKKGGFGGYARNLGLDIARGKWLLFADADDYFNPCIGDILDEYADADADVIYFKANSVDNDTYIQTFRARHRNQTINLFVKNRSSAEILLRYHFGEPWSKLVRRSMVEEHGIRFWESTIHNDTEFSYLIGYHAREIAVDMRALYCVTVRGDSVSANVTEKRKLERIEIFARASLFFRQHDIPKDETYHFRQLCLSRKENAQTYRAGVDLLLGMGFSRKEIRKGMRLEGRKLRKQRMKTWLKMLLFKLLHNYAIDGNIVVEVQGTIY